MNKLGIVLGAAAVVTLAGCVDPNYRRPGEASKTAVKQVEPVVVEKPVAKPVEPKQKLPEIVETEKTCTCAPGTKHTAPCACDAKDCACVVEKPVVVKPVVKPVAPVEETTDYIVQRGDYLAKISKKYNVTIAGIRRVNPQLKDDKIRIGQKIKLPGKVAVGEQTVPKGAFAETPKAAPKAYAPFTGATKEYVVKAGDTLGAIAYRNGINIRQLKELNGLSSNTIRVGQKLKIPAEKVAKAEAKPAATAKVTPTKDVKPVEKKVEEKKPVTPPAPPVETKVEKVEETKDAAPVAPPVVEEKKADTPPTTTGTQPTEGPKVDTTPAQPAAAAAAGDNSVTYVVQEGEDILNLSIRFSLSPAEIRELNNLGSADQVKPGQVLKLPADTQL